MSGWSGSVVTIASAIASALVAACSFTPPGAGIGDDADVPPPSVAFAAASSTTDETAGTVDVLVQLSETAAAPVTVAVTVGGSATQGTDFALASTEVSFGVGEQQAAISLAILDDADMTEQAETIELTLTSPSGATLGAPSTHTVTIADHRLPRIQLSTATSSTMEDAPTTLTLTLDLPAEGDSSVQLALSGTATQGDDYALVADTVVAIPTGETSVTVDVGEINDALDEEDAETLIVQLVNPSPNLIVGDVGTQTHSILDNDDPPKVRFDAPTTTIAETGGSTTIAVSLDAPSGRTVTVEYAVSGGNAVAADATVVGAPGTLTFPAGTVGQTITVNVTDDQLDEDDEDVDLTLSNPDNASLGLKDHTVTITDDDLESEVQFDPAESDRAVDEGDPPPATTKFTYDVVLDKPSGKSINVAVDFSGDAGANDFTASGLPIVFSPGQTRKTITLDIVADDDGEQGNSDFIIMTINGTTSTNVRVGLNDERVHEILDDD